MRTSPLTSGALASRLDRQGVSLPETAIHGLVQYLGLLTKWNKAMNLVGTQSWENTLDTLVVDSFHLAAFLPGIGLSENPFAADLGAGAGLPGIPLRLLWREGTYTLVEVREKRALFMQTALALADFGRTTVFRGRAEDFFALSGPIDLLVSRAFMPWRDLLGFVSGALAPRGRVVMLTLAPPPGALPDSWRLVTQTAYNAAGTTRHFWCLARDSA